MTPSDLAVALRDEHRDLTPRKPASAARPIAPAAVSTPQAAKAPAQTQKTASWRQAFRAHKLGYFSLIILGVLYVISLAAPLVSNDRPLLVLYEGSLYFPLLKDYPEAVFGGNLPILTDYLDPFIKQRLTSGGNFALYAPNPYSFDTIAYYADGLHHPGAPTRDNLLGTDPTGLDILAQLIYGFRISVTFALGLTIFGTALGILIGAVQGYFAGKIDLVAQRLIEVWGAMPELYLLIIFASLFNQNFVVLFVLMTLFGWVNVSDYVRAEFLRNRQLEYVKAGRALGLSSWQIMWRHILPNSLTPVITYLPFRMSAGIMALASLDFLGLGVTNAPSLGRLLLQGKENLDAWWISVSAFGALVTTLLLLTFIGEALRAALNTHAADRFKAGAA